MKGFDHGCGKSGRIRLVSCDHGQGAGETAQLLGKIFALLQAVDTAVELNKTKDYGIPVPDYIEENVSTKVVKIIQSYTGIVNRMVWRKY